MDHTHNLKQSSNQEYRYKQSGKDSHNNENVPHPTPQACTSSFPQEKPSPRTTCNACHAFASSSCHPSDLSTPRRPCLRAAAGRGSAPACRSRSLRERRAPPSTWGYGLQADAALEVLAALRVCVWEKNTCFKVWKQHIVIAKSAGWSWPSQCIGEADEGHRSVLTNNDGGEFQRETESLWEVWNIKTRLQKVSDFVYVKWPM